MTADQIQIGGDDRIIPFHVEPLEIRGRAVQLGPMITTILERHDYPDSVSKLLAEVVVMAVLLGTSLKFEGRFTVQTQTNGPVSLLVVDLKTPDEVRAYASFDETKLTEAHASGNTGSAELLGKGILAMTIDPGGSMQRYQGIVELDGTSLEEVAQAYFRQSEQIPTHLRLAVSEVVLPAKEGHGSTRNWRAGGVMIQFLPEMGGKLTVRDIPGGDAPYGSTDATSEERNDLWIEAKSLLSTVSDDELTDPAIPAEVLLYRLFHERGVHVFEGPQMRDKCSCSRERIIKVLKTLPAEDLADSWQDDKIVSKCEFCNTTHTLTPADMAPADMAPADMD